jgi:hypothetical protein
MKLSHSLSLLAFATVAAGTVHAAQFGVTVNLPNLANENIALLFQLTNANSAANTATITNFQFLSAAANGAPTFQGGGSGSLAGGIIIQDTGNPNLATVPLLPNGTPAAVTFNVLLTENFNSPNPGDFFGLNVLLDGLPFTSNDPSGANLFVAAAITQFGVTPQAFELGRGISATVGDPFPDNNAVPEPSTFALLGAGIALIGIRRLASQK